jgi:hypothetical protein
MKHTKRVWLLLLLLVVGLATAQAQQPAGEMELEKGHVKIRRQSQDRVFREAGKRIPVFEGDVLHSGRDTRAKIYFREGQDVISLFSNTMFRVETVSQENTFFGLNIGKAVFKVLSRFRNDKFNVRTPTATIGVKGTEFVTGSDGQKTFLLTVTGTVGMASVDFPERVVIVTQNKASHVEPRKLPSPPVSVPPAAQEQILTQEGVETFEAVPFQPPPAEEPAAKEKEGGEEGGEEEEEGEEEGTAEEGEEAPAEGEEVAADVEETPVIEEPVSDIIADVAEVQAVVETVEDVVSEGTEAVSVTDDVGLPEEVAGPRQVDITITR